MPETTIDAAALRRSAIADLIRETRLIAVLRRVEPQARLLELVADLAADGVLVFEITFDAPAAVDDVQACRALLDQRGHHDAIVGGGTVRSVETLDAARRAGAAFVVSPALDPMLVARSVALGLPVVPGAYTPTEVDLAWSAGATFVKLFPASSLGPTHARELRGPFPEIECIATGGIDASNAEAFLDAGCVAVGVGSAITRATPAQRRALVDSVRRAS